MKAPTALCILATIVSAFATGSTATISMPKIFGSHMVLQRGIPLPVWGTAEPGEKIIVIFAGQKVATTTGADGRWKVQLAPMEASSENRTFSVRGSKLLYPLQFKNVLVGEVWFCSGQSNMEWSVRKSNNAEKEIAGAEFPAIRLIRTPHKVSSTPSVDTDMAWQVCSPKSIVHFTGAGYFFAREIHGTLSVPIGIIQSTWGGTRIESWISSEALQGEPAAGPITTAWKAADNAYDPAWSKAEYLKRREKWKIKSARAKAEGRTLPRRPSRPIRPLSQRNAPSNLFNSMVHPVIPFGIKGVLWYQGESNRKRAHQYETLFPLLIRDWRQQWGQGDFPFYYVQIANYSPWKKGTASSIEWVELQEAQRHTLSTPNTGMVVANDIGNAKDIHPGNKQEIGRRLALWALHNEYGKSEATPSGPLFFNFRKEGDKIRVYFKYANGLKTRETSAPLTGFLIADKNQKWHHARALIDGETVILSNPAVPYPVAARYAWSSNPTNANLVNAAGLPASVFRTDNWPSLTKKNTVPRIDYIKPEATAIGR